MLQVVRQTNQHYGARYQKLTISSEIHIVHAQKGPLTGGLLLELTSETQRAQADQIENLLITHIFMYID